MARLHPSPRDRIGGAALTALMTAALGYALLAGLAVRFVPGVEPALATFDIVLRPSEPPPPPAAEKPARAPRREGAAAPPNLTSRATDLVALQPVVPIVTPPLITTLQAGMGSEPTSGNASVVGPGTGSGGTGNGTGSGGAGNGEGGGGGGTPPRQISGKISKRDYPRDLFAANIQGKVGVLYVVAPSGRVTDCEIEHSSGSAELDDLTFDLIVRRFRFRPSLDAQGRPVESMVAENHSWIID
jgi:protein TonB